MTRSIGRRIMWPVGLIGLVAAAVLLPADRGHAGEPDMRTVFPEIPEGSRMSLWEVPIEIRHIARTARAKHWLATARVGDEIWISDVSSNRLVPLHTYRPGDPEHARLLTRLTKGRMSGYGYVANQPSPAYYDLFNQCNQCTAVRGYLGPDAPDFWRFSPNRLMPKVPGETFNDLLVVRDGQWTVADWAFHAPNSQYGRGISNRLGVGFDRLGLNGMGGSSSIIASQPDPRLGYRFGRGITGDAVLQGATYWGTKRVLLDLGYSEETASVGGGTAATGAGVPAAKWFGGAPTWKAAVGANLRAAPLGPIMVAPIVESGDTNGVVYTAQHGSKHDYDIMKWGGNWVVYGLSSVWNSVPGVTFTLESYQSPNIKLPTWEPTYWDYYTGPGGHEPPGWKPGGPQW